MLYDNIIKEAVFDTLIKKVLNTANLVQILFKEGYIPNKNKFTIISWGLLLIEAYQNIDSLFDDEQTKLNVVYNKIMDL